MQTSGASAKGLLDSHAHTRLSLLCTFQNESLMLSQQRAFETGAISAIKLLGIREVFPVIKTGTGVHRLQTRESAVTGSALLATDCSLDKRRLDGIGQRRRNGRGRGSGGDNMRLLDPRQLSAGCGFYATVLLFCSVVSVESTRFHCYLSQTGICDWHLCSASPPLPRVRVIFNGMRGIVMRGSLKQTHKGQCSVND